MSINHYSSEHSQPQWWPHPHYNNMMDSSSSSSPDRRKPSFCHNNQMFSSRNGTVSSFDLNNDDDDDGRPTAAHDAEEEDLPKERLFEKPLTPSDVGKLNRLVIPKQHAEKHFPLNGGAAEPGENGLLLGFEDEAGKSWRFRYSYWNSSQSYVLTKGWSRFVKEKRLDAGDIVVFARHRVDTGRLFIGWRRRNSAGPCVSHPAAAAAASGAAAWGRSGFNYPGQYAYPGQHLQASGPFSSMPYQSESIHAGTVVQEQQQQQSQTGSGNSKRLRLFGVNLECYESEEASSTPMGPAQAQSQSQSQAHHHHHQYYSNHHMDIGFSGGADVYHRQG